MNLTRIMMAVALGVLTGLPVAAGAQALPGQPVASRSTVKTIDGRACVLTAFDIPGEWNGQSRLLDPYFEFSLPEESEADLVTFTAYLVAATPEGTIDLDLLPAVSGWEITPMERVADLGRYVRLYLPEDLPARAGADGRVRLLVASTEVTAADLAEGVIGGRLTGVLVEAGDVSE